MGSQQPYYRKSMPQESQSVDDYHGDLSHIDLTYAHMDPYGQPDPVAEAVRRFDRRAAAAVYADARASGPMLIDDTLFHIYERRGPVTPDEGNLIENVPYPSEVNVPPVWVPATRCLSLLAFNDYFPWDPVIIDPEETFLDPTERRSLVSRAILAANPGWCGTFGPGTDAATDLGSPTEGNYDMSQMYLLKITYRYYTYLTPEAQDHLINSLLKGGTIHRPGKGDTHTSGGMLGDWLLAGDVNPLGAPIIIGETENHIMMILTARYLTNQLLWQRTMNPDYDNRRNGSAGAPHCTDAVLTLLRNILRCDVSEYNAKPYQTQTRSALLNLHDFAYDHEVRLAARMVLDYISAHIAVSSNDLRRMVPFRRRNEAPYNARITSPTYFVTPPQGKPGQGSVVAPEEQFMDVSLLDVSSGADQMAQMFAMQAGNTRAYETPSEESPYGAWSIRTDLNNGNNEVFEALSDYRLPPSVHDLFVNDMNRQFFQTLHRTVKIDEPEHGRNCDNHEIYAGSPSYLITAGGEPATYAIDPGWTQDLPVIGDKVLESSHQQLGVSVTTSFMPTGRHVGPNTQARARDLIQFSSFSELGTLKKLSTNYGVAPDFACGFGLHLPGWVIDLTLIQGIRRMVELGHIPKSKPVKVSTLLRQAQVTPRGSVRSLLYKMREIAANNIQLDGEFLFVNRGSSLPGNWEPAGFYLAIFKQGRLAIMEAFDTWLHPNVTFEEFKAGVLQRNAGMRLTNNEESQYTMFFSGTRVSFTIWGTPLVPFEKKDFSNGAVITKMEPPHEPGIRNESFLSGTIMNSPSDAVVVITNPLLGTTLTLDMSDAAHPKRVDESGRVEEAGNKHEVWVDFDWHMSPSEGDFFRPFNKISDALGAVAEGGTLRFTPGSTVERPSIKKRVRLVAPIGGVTIGAR
jgi:hypothetical protein